MVSHKLCYPIAAVIFLFFLLVLLYRYPVWPIGTDHDIVIESCTNPPEQDQARWTVIVIVIEILNQLSAPYLLSDGSLLHLYRNCSVGLSDIDFSLDLGWWKENKGKLDEKLEDAGFTQTAVFGDIGHFGYTEAWGMYGIKVDILSSIMEGNIRVLGLWVQGRLFPCHMPVRWVSTYLWRGSVRVRIPVPVEDTMIATYGRNYDYPVVGWQWDVSPFLTGYCSYKNIDIVY